MRRAVPLSLLWLATGLSFAAGCASTEQGSIVEGFYTFGAEVEVLQPCLSEQVYWLYGEGEKRRRLRAAHASLTTTPYQKVYVRVRARPGEKATQGFPADYDGTMVLEEILEVRAPGLGDCRARGTS